MAQPYKYENHNPKISMNGELVLAVSQQNSKLERTNSADERITHHIWDVVFEEQTASCSMDAY